MWQLHCNWEWRSLQLFSFSFFVTWSKRASGAQDIGSRKGKRGRSKSCTTSKLCYILSPRFNHMTKPSCPRRLEMVFLLSILLSQINWCSAIRKRENRYRVGIQQFLPKYVIFFFFFFAEYIRILLRIKDYKESAHGSWQVQNLQRCPNSNPQASQPLLKPGRASIPVQRSPKRRT